MHKTRLVEEFEIHLQAAQKRQRDQESSPREPVRIDDDDTDLNHLDD